MPIFKGMRETRNSGHAAARISQQPEAAQIWQHWMAILDSGDDQTDITHYNLQL